MSDKNLQEVQIHSLIDILRKELNYYKDMLALSMAKRKVIIENRVSELDKMLKLEQNMIFDIGQLEKSRDEAVKKISFLLGMKPDNLTLTEIGKHAADQDKKELEQIQKQLTRSISEIKENNDLNGELIKQSLEYIDYSINVITSSGTQTSSLYDDLNDNSKGTATKKRIFDTKI